MNICGATKFLTVSEEDMFSSDHCSGAAVAKRQRKTYDSKSP
ncbi:hypothetical protein L917_14470 [Phytophthora nicotianae]|uniref:Uncharacterized protein n=1 Tax=Phytophthora nicotianae TaxID=4792 RepID=W2KLM5_PHYNI|nr:hypothetical protein L917_14470 [Phytophthora nicotianae]